MRPALPPEPALACVPPVLIPPLACEPPPMPAWEPAMPARLSPLTPAFPPMASPELPPSAGPNHSLGSSSLVHPTEIRHEIPSHRAAERTRCFMGSLGRACAA